MDNIWLHFILLFVDWRFEYTAFLDKKCTKIRFGLKHHDLFL